MMRSTNLALRPFRNERLPWLLALLLIVAAAGISLAHARFVNRLLSGDEANTVLLVREDEARIAALEDDVATQPSLKIEEAELRRIRAFKELVDRRVFPWRLLLLELETALPESVRLTAISPAVRRDAKGMLVQLQGRARTKDAAFSFAEALDAAPAFSRTVLKALNEVGQDVGFSLEVEFGFDPPEAPASSPPPTPKPGPRGIS